MGEIKAIETEYNGNRYRSKLEARWAVFFDAMNIEYKYEPEGYVGWEGVKYLPDFYLPYEKLYVEVKGYDEQLEKDWDKIAAAIDWQSTPVSDGLLLLGDIPNPDKVGWGSLPVFNYLYWRQGVASDYAAFVHWHWSAERRCQSRIALGIDEIMDAMYGIDYSRDFSEYGQPMPQNLSTRERWIDPDMLTSRHFESIEKAYREARYARFDHGQTPAPNGR